jgi:hypothetical protein
MSDGTSYNKAFTRARLQAADELRHGHAWPAFAGGLTGGERHGQVLYIRYMLDNASSTMHRGGK